MSEELFLYAELLLNIKSVSVLAEISSREPRHLTAELSASSNEVTLRCQDQTLSSCFPVKFSAPFSSSKELTSNNSPQSLEARLPTELVPQLDDAHADEHVPWLAPTLCNTDTIHCRVCHNVVVPANSVDQWKDLPSEGWAEMMDFWHCHKPTAPATNGDSHEHSSKGYAASNRFLSRQGTGLVSASSFVFHINDCRGVSVGLSSFISSTSITIPGRRLPFSRLIS